MNSSPWDDIPGLQSTTPFDPSAFSVLCPRETSVLDLGCGYGRICRLLESLDYTKLTGVDISIVQLERARRCLAHTVLILADIRRLPFDDEHFDHAITLGVLDSLVDAVELGDAIRECARVLKPGGYWFVNFYTRNASRYFDDKYASGLDDFKEKRVFRSNTGLVFRHYSLAQFLTFTDVVFDAVKCELKEFLSMNQERKVAGYCLILRKPQFVSSYR